MDEGKQSVGLSVGLSFGLSVCRSVGLSLFFIYVCSSVYLLVRLPVSLSKFV